MRSFALALLATALVYLAPLPLFAGSITLPVVSAGLLNFVPSSLTPFFAPLSLSEIGDLSIYSDSRSGRNGTDAAIEFDLGVLRGQTVLSATLNLTANGTQMITSAPSLRATSFLDDDLVVDSSDFAKSVGPVLSSTGNLPFFAAPDTISVPLIVNATEFVTQALASTSPGAGFVLRVLQAGISLDGLGVGGSAPHLVVTVASDLGSMDAVPEPAGVVLLGVGLTFTSAVAAMRHYARD